MNIPEDHPITTLSAVTEPENKKTDTNKKVARLSDFFCFILQIPLSCFDVYVRFHPR